MYHQLYYRGHVNVAVDVIWGVVTEHERFKEWTNIDWDVTQTGSDHPNGLGCVREATFAVQDGEPETLVEIVNVWQPNKLYGYHITSGLPLERHQGLVRFWPQEDGTTKWLYDLRIKALPEMGDNIAPWYAELTGSFQYFMHDIEAECERRGFGIDMPCYPLPVEEPLKLGA